MSSTTPLYKLPGVRRRYRHIEDAHQAAVISWAAVHGLDGKAAHGQALRILDYLFAIPNGGKRDAREAARLVGQGVKAGVSDLMLAYPAHSKHGLWIEMKSPDGHATDDQRLWIDRMSAVGYAAVIAHGFDAARAAIVNYLSSGTP